MGDVAGVEGVIMEDRKEEEVVLVSVEGEETGLFAGVDGKTIEDFANVESIVIAGVFAVDFLLNVLLGVMGKCFEATVVEFTPTAYEPKN